MTFCINGFGTRITSEIRLVGEAEKQLAAKYPGLLEQHEGAEFQVVIKAITALFIPIIPLKRMIILKLKDGRYIELEKVDGIVQHAINSLGFQIGFAFYAITIAYQIYKVFIG
jgi:hypothetical protein